jgi:hypothetical protein
LFIGQQATGKSLMMQLFYFFRSLRYLVAAKASEEEVSRGKNELVRSLLDRLRRGIVRERSRAFAALVEGTVKLAYTPPTGGEKWRLSISGGTLRTTVFRKSPLLTLLRDWTSGQSWRERGQKKLPALYVPAERSFYSRYLNAGAGVLSSPELPLTMLTFTDAIERAKQTYQSWTDGIPPTPEGQKIWYLAKKALAGEAYIPTHGPKLWKWRTPQGKILDLEMASSGQMEAWPLVLIAASLFSWRNEGLLDDNFYLCIEEPETHLHPAAQVAMVELLAYLVNQGFNVVVTTHSLTVLYALNNLLVASDLGDYEEEKIPQLEVRLRRGQVGVYFCSPDGEVVELVDEETGLIPEGQLAAVDEALDTQLNRLEFLRAYGTTGKRNV